MHVHKVNTPYKFGNTDSLGFEHVTFVPFDKKLIEINLLSQQDIQWINKYHQECRTILEPLLKDKQTLNWVEKETESI